MGKASADGAMIANLYITNDRGALCKKRKLAFNKIVIGYISVCGTGADHNFAILFPDPFYFTDACNVYKF